MVNFSVNNVKYAIGSEMFPVAEMSKLKIFTSENTCTINDITLGLNLDKYHFTAGRAYSNTDFVVKLGKLFHRDIKFYSGWLFLPDNKPPMHHTWAVYDDNVIDVSIDKNAFDLFSDVDLNDPNFRDKTIDRHIEYLNKKIPTTKSKIFGQVPNWLIYLGTPDTYKNVRKTAGFLINNFTDHPSYCPVNERRETKYQELFRKKQHVLTQKI